MFFIRRNSDNKISDVCLAMKRRGFGSGKWNGFGGKVGDKKKETIKEAACREVFEEMKSRVLPQDLEKVAEIDFKFDNNPRWVQVVSVFFTKEWLGEPEGGEEMITPKWFKVEDIPYAEMWVTDEFWLGMTLKDHKIEGKVSFTENGENLKNITLDIVDRLGENDEFIERKLS